MNSDLRRRFIRDLVRDMAQVGGSRFEEMAGVVFDAITPNEVQSRGLNLEGASVQGTVDSVTTDGSSVAEYSSLVGYFSRPLDKFRHDIRHARKKHPGARSITLFSSRECGPEAADRLVRHANRYRRAGLALEVYDARRLAETITDRLLLDGARVERLKSFLPNLERIAEQAALSHHLPSLDLSYRGREQVEEEVLQRLERERVLVIHGMGGVGKTELVCAVAHRAEDQFELVIWVQAEDVTRFEDLLACDVRRNGYKMNLAGLLKSHRTLLVLDNIQVDIGVAQLKAACGSDSCVLVTTQVATHAQAYELLPLPPGPDEAILGEGVTEPCPQDVLAIVRKTVGGLPLVLRILNAHLRYEGYTWQQVADDCRFAAEQEDNQHRRVADRLLARHRETVGRELAFFVWCGMPLVDRGLLVQAIGEVGIGKLSRRAFLVRSQSDVIRLHDLVFASVDANKDSLPLNAELFLQKLDTYIVKNVEPKGLPLFRVVHRHRELIGRLAQQLDAPDSIRYAYVLGNEPPDLSPRCLVDPDVASSGVEALAPAARHLRLALILDTIEAEYRRTRALTDAESAKKDLVRRLIVYERLLSLPGLSPEEQQLVRHHRGKSLLKLGREADARAEFEAVLASVRPLTASKLQLARLLKNEPGRARSLLIEIFESEKRQAGSVSTSVLLGAFESAGLKHLSTVVDEMVEKHGEFVANVLKNAAFHGFDQPIHAFVSVGRQWSFKAPELFLEVFDELPRPRPEEVNENREIFDHAELLKAAGKAAARLGDNERAQSFYCEASNFYRLIRQPDSYQARAVAENLILLRSFPEAAALLEQVRMDKRDSFWNYRRAQAWLGAGQPNEALVAIDNAIAACTKPEDEKYLPTFLEFRSQIRKEMRDPEFLEDLRRAIQKCKDAKYRKNMEDSLALAEAQQGGTGNRQDS